MTTIQKLLSDIQTITQNPSLSMIDKDIALEKMRKLYEEINALSTHTSSTIIAQKVVENKPEPIVETVKIEPQQIQQTFINTAPEIKMQETLSHESNAESLNDILNKNRKTELADKLEHSPIKDLKAFIGFNDKFSFVQNLFGSNSETYKNVIDQFNSFTDKTDAEKLIHELSSKHNWHENTEVAEQFKEIINRKFL